MKLNHVFSIWTLAIGVANAALPSSVDRSVSLLRNRPPGKFRLTDANPETIRHLQSKEYSTIDGHSCFRDLDGMINAMFDLRRNYPDLVSIADIGDSYLKSIGDANGHDIYVMKISSSKSSDPSQVFFTGGQHARELAPPELLMRFAEQLVAGYDQDADIAWILDTTQINIILYVNPDGRAIAETEHNAFWRKNVNPDNGTCPDESIGTDLNRNYDWMWGDTSGASSDPCAEFYHGRRPESEPEVQAVVAFAKTLFPQAQRKKDPVAEIDVPYGEDVTGIYMDIHSYGGLTIYPWAFEDKASADNNSLEALGRKLSYFNGNVLWANGHPDFLYPATGISIDYMYAHMGVASLGLEIGDDFYQNCDTFERTVYPNNLNTLMYVIKLAKKPNAIAKGPDITDLNVSERDGKIIVSVDASDSELVNIDGYPSFVTGEQTVSKVEVYLDVLPEEYGDGNLMYSLEKTPEWPLDWLSGLFGLDWLSGLFGSGSGTVFETEIGTNGLSSGRHVLYARATDSEGYFGPISSVFFKVTNVTTTTDELETNLTSNERTYFAPSKKPSLAPMLAELTLAATKSLRIPSTNNTESESSTSSPARSFEPTDETSSGTTSSESLENAAASVSVHAVLMLALSLFTYLR